MKIKNLSECNDNLINEDITRIFERRVSENPEKIAITCGKDSISYDKLNRHANMLAGYLVSQGVGADEVVALFAERGIDFAASVLAIFKAGGAYLPLNPEHPAKRQHKVIEQSGVSLIVVTRKLEPLLKKLLEDYHGRKLKVLIAEEGTESTQTADNLPLRCSPDNLAYVIFTSGSTGIPKGAMVERKGMINHLYSKINRLEITCEDRIAQIASQCFDISVWQYFAPLLAGGQVHVFNDETARDPGRILEQIEEDKITIFHVVPSMLRQIINKIEECGADRFKLSDLRWLVLSGEALPPLLCQKWLAYYPNIRLLNFYGPTECADGVTEYVVNEPPAENIINMSIGKAIENIEVYVTEPGSMKLCAQGEAGELCITGAGVGRGYINNAEKTAEVFLNNPFSDKPDYMRLYRTGDLVKYLSDGDIEFLGRIDRQVKIRGFRIELAEIEYFISRYEGIKACVVTARSVCRNKTKLVAREYISEQADSEDESARIVAYIVCQKDISDSSLRTYLGDNLPEYMIPEFFVRITEIPVNSNGKADMKALPDPENIRPYLDKPYIEPGNDMEKAVASAWREILGIDRVGVKDGFFELGGDSLLAMKVLNRIEEFTGIKLSYSDIFTQTVSQLAEKINKNNGKNNLLDTMSEALPENGLYPLSLEQQRLWFLCKLEPGNPYYTLQGFVTINGSLDIAAFNNAWQEVFKRHDALKADFIEKDGVVYQMFKDDETLEIPYEDISAMSEEGQEIYLKKAAGKEVFVNLEEGPLFRLHLFKTSGKKYIMLLTTYEIIMDAWSLSVIIRDLKAEYYSRLSGAEAKICEGSLKFRNYVLWESKNLTKDLLKPEEGYWRRQLSGELPVLKLPTDNMQGKVPSYKGGEKAVLLNPELSKKLKLLGRQKDCTLFMTLLAAFNILLHNYTGQEDIIIGSPHVNRNHPGAESLVGFFLNMIPFRTNLSGEQTFTSLLQSVKNAVTDGFANSNYPFLWMAELAETVRNRSVSPVFQVMFNMYSERDDGADLSNGELDIVFRELETGYTKYGLTLYAQESRERIYLQFSYFTDLFSDSFIERMLKNFETLLRSIVNNPESPISGLEVLDKDEKALLLDSMNRTDKDFENTLTISQLFELQVKKTPDNAAYIYQGKSISYSELNKRANKLAHYLIKSGVERETLVAICVERSFDMAAGLIGIIKAGGAYVALDSDYPESRLCNILEDTKAQFLVVQRSTDYFADFEGNKIFIDDEVINSEADNNIESVSGINDLFNVVYTSSSTGRPKGVLITAKSVINRLVWMWEAYPFKSDDVAVIQKSYALVAAAWEIFGGLLKGIPALILSRQNVLDPAEFWRQAVEHRVSFLLASPPLLKGVIGQAELHPGQWSSLRLATTSAEPIPPVMTEQWYKVFPEVPLLNLYGSTECSSNATAYDTREMTAGMSSVPLGKPLDNTKIYILNKHLKPVPIGVVGEMCISGSCVSRGYLNNQKLTSECFITNPVSGEDSPLYRTGDLVRYMEDGNIQLTGRHDHQIKLRGFRIEPAEIEMALEEYAPIKRAAVILNEDKPEDKYLVAFIAANNGETPAYRELRSFLSGKLPDYMIPAKFVLLETMPLTNSGKIARKALSLKDGAILVDAETQHIKPQDEIEETLTDIWKEVLGAERVGVNDNFFEIGGQSLKAISVMNKIQEKLNVEIWLSNVFDNLTIKGIAEEIRKAAAGTGQGGR